MKVQRGLSVCFLLAAGCETLDAQSTGTLRGTVELKGQATALHHATVSILQLDRRVTTKEDGGFEFTNLPPGRYDVMAHVHALIDDRKSVQIVPGGVTEANFQLSFAAYREQVTVTASGREELATDAFQAVTTLDSLELATKNAPSLGEVLDREAGVAKRSFGPGTTRPVIRGFDGDRVLVLQDGVRTGTLSSQSGDHGEPIDTSSLERLEVVRGPATLLYGSNAIGGVVNAITGHHQLHSHPHEGLRGYLTGGAGSANAYGAGSGGFEYGAGNWLLWGKGGSQRTGDYSTPIGEIPNSGSRVTQSSAGLGRYAGRGFFSLGYTLQDGKYGIPSVLEHLGGEEGDVDVAFRRHNLRLDTGLHNGLGPAFDQFTISLDYSDWNHRELEGEEVGTRFKNQQIVARGVLDQRKVGRLSGSLGFTAMNRKYEALGEEALAPPVEQNAIALFGLEEIDFERIRIQLGGRVENNRYSPRGLPKRSFTGFSGAAGVHVPLWKGGAAVANFTHSYRAPALEELYNRGPHLGNLTFEIGNSSLRRERTEGLDLSLRQRSDGFHGEVNLFYYSLRDFVYLAPTGAIEDGLIEADYAQADARNMGVEARSETRLHPNVWLLLGFDAVDAQLKRSRTPLPRIPPVRGRLGFDLRAGGLSVRPELVLANKQHQLFPGETRTPGYGLLNLNASYTLSSRHLIHVFAVNLFNATDHLYRNHLSFIKDFAPEIGRGVRFNYTLRFF